MKKALICLISLFFITLAAYSAEAAYSWVEVYSDEEYRIFAEKTSIVYMGDEFEVAERWEYKTAEAQKRAAKMAGISGTVPAYDVTIKVYKKAQPAYRIISVTYYDSKGAEIHTTPKDYAWRILSAGMLGEELWKNITKLLKQPYELL